MRGPAEKKVIDTTLATYNLVNTGTVTLINGVATGTDFTQRIGRKINCTSVQLRAFFQVTSTTASETDMTPVRVMLVYDSQTNGVIPTIADILNEASATSFMNLNNRERFRVLYDKMTTIPAFNVTAATQNSTNVPTLNVYKKCWIPVIFEGTAATIGSIASGAIYLVTLSNGATNNVVLDASMRVRFEDA